jgi:hypothetical protein
LSIHANPLLPEGARHVQANEVSFKATQKALPVVDKAVQNLATEIQRLKNKMERPPADTTIAGVNLAHEVRDALRAMTAADRRKEITKSLDQHDDSVISAIMSAPLMLSGLSAIERDNYAAMWRAKKFPAEIVRLARLEKGRGRHDLGRPAFRRLPEKNVRAGDCRRGREIRESVRRRNRGNGDSLNGNRTETDRAARLARAAFEKLAGRRRAPQAGGGIAGRNAF